MNIKLSFPEDNKSAKYRKKIMLNTFTLCQDLAKPNSFGDICEKLLSDPYVLLLLTAAMFFDRSKI